MIGRISKYFLIHFSRALGQILLGRAFRILTADGELLKSIAIMTKVSASWLFPKVIAQSFLNSSLTVYNSVIRDIADYIDETLAILLPVKLC